MTTIPTVEIGMPGNRTRVPRVGLGTMSMPAVHGAIDDEECLNVLNHAIDIGCTLWDTADMYSLGDTEKLLSRVLKERRDEVFLCTKFGIATREPDAGETVANHADFITGFNGTPEYMRKCIDESLERLGVDHIDLYYNHFSDSNTPIEETVTAMAELVKEGKVHCLGLSNCSAEDIRRAHKVHPISAVQVEYSAWNTAVEVDGVLDTCRELGIALVAYSPLGHGLLFGNVRSHDGLPEDDWRRTHPRFKEESPKNNLKFVNAIEEMAKKYNSTPGQLALAWLLAQYDNLIAIPGTKRIKYLDENFAAGQIKLSSEDLMELRKLVDNANIRN
ncbi:hypothetical protein LPJ59_004116 [Coemansia sp. RSA 2399]|nr:hypothetical protein LPJ59_004116 [Coemansia sp. RSA 2399]KAJ1901110.1 hypothetical protein LPJ81_003815 [Coemansia sp. IMI 209127]